MASEGEAVTPGQRLQALISDLGLSNRQVWKRLAEKRGITEDTAKSNLSKWLVDKHHPDQENALAMIAILGPKARFLLTRQHGGVQTILAMILDRMAAVEARLDQLEDPPDHQAA